MHPSLCDPFINIDMYTRDPGDIFEDQDVGLKTVPPGPSRVLISSYNPRSTQVAPGVSKNVDLRNASNTCNSMLKSLSSSIHYQTDMVVFETFVVEDSGRSPNGIIERYMVFINKHRSQGGGWLAFFCYLYSLNISAGYINNRKKS